MVFHPGGDGLVVELLESNGEGAVAAKTALLSQFRGGGRTQRGDAVAVESHEMLDAQAVDIRIIGDVLLGEILTKVGAVGADGGGELLQGEIVLQIELGGFAVLFQQGSDIQRNVHGGIVHVIIF